MPRDFLLLENRDRRALAEPGAFRDVLDTRRREHPLDEEIERRTSTLSGRASARRRNFGPRCVSALPVSSSSHSTTDQPVIYIRPASHSKHISKSDGFSPAVIRWTPALPPLTLAPAGLTRKEADMANRKVRWGIISTANRGWPRSFPAFSNAPFEVVALGSRDLAKAEAALQQLGLAGTAKDYGTYEELFADPMSTPSTTAAQSPACAADPRRAKAGKHVLAKSRRARREGSRALRESRGHVFYEALWCASTRSGSASARSSVG